MRRAPVASPISSASHTPVAASAPTRSEAESEAVETRGRIFNSLTIPRNSESNQSESSINTPSKNMEMPRRDPKPVDPIDEDDNDDWGAVPAFLRRSKLK